MSKLYYCTKCKQKHITRKAVGQSHLKFAGEAPVEVIPPPSGTNPTYVLPAVEGAENIVTCETCEDTGFVPLGVNARAFCKCGQETHDERIGLMPRRPDLGPAKPISDEDRAEAVYRRSHGGTHDEYLAGIGQSTGGGDPEPPGQPDESKEPEAYRLDGEADETVLQEAGDGVPDRQGDSTV